MGDNIRGRRQDHRWGSNGPCDQRSGTTHDISSLALAFATLAATSRTTRGSTTGSSNFEQVAVCKRDALVDDHLLGESIEVRALLPDAFEAAFASLKSTLSSSAPGA